MKKITSRAWCSTFIMFLFIVPVVLFASAPIPLRQKHPGHQVEPEPADPLPAIPEPYPDKSHTVTALLQTWGNYINRVIHKNGGTIFIIGQNKIYYKNGKMLSPQHLARYHEYDPIFYTYSPGPLVSLPPPQKYPDHRSSDFLDALFGNTESQIRSTCRWISFLGHKVYMQEICAEPLKRVEQKIRAAARSSPGVRKFISNISRMYSMVRRKVSGTDNMSYHAYGLALDIIPRNFHSKHVFWRWSGVYESEWKNIPLSQRWHPPWEVIKAFEENGFIWGGKWYHFDNIHFEYRPELLFSFK